MIGRVGSYEILGFLGRGSTGIVLKGFDRALNRIVAIKVLDPAVAGAGTARQRFAREARAMAAISHEHVVPVYGVDEHAGLPYFVMEYVAGGSLERRLKRKAISTSYQSFGLDCRSLRRSPRLTATGSSIATSSRQTS